jgi:Arc/MetJ family transcription regulator
MRTTLTIDDKLLVKASQLTGLTEKSELVTEAVRALIERERARGLSQREKTVSRLAAIRRHRSHG